jgi:HEPN domain-containing protein
MHKPLPKTDLLVKLEHLDRQFDAEGMALKYRAAECLKECYGSVPDGPHRKALFEPIQQWLTERYGDQALWDGILGRIPLTVRGRVYLAAIEFTETDIVRDFRIGIEGLPKDISDSLDLHEFNEIAEKRATAQLSLNAIYTLRNDDHLLTAEQRELTRRAQFDLDNSPLTLKHNQDTQTAIFFAKEAAEKFLKVALLKSPSNRKPKEFKHGISGLFTELVRVAPRYSWLQKVTAAIQQTAPDMELRYKKIPRNIASAISTFRSALNLCGVLAQMWNFDHQRGTQNSEFEPSSFYVNGTGLYFWCKQIGADQAALIAFELGDLRGIAPKEKRSKCHDSRVHSI